MTDGHEADAPGTADHDLPAEGAGVRRALAYGFVVALLITPFVVFAVGVGSDFAISSTVTIVGGFAVVWAWCTWLLRTARASWLLGTFLTAVAAVVVVLVGA